MSNSDLASFSFTLALVIVAVLVELHQRLAGYSFNLDQVLHHETIIIFLAALLIGYHLYPVIQQVFHV